MNNNKKFMNKKLTAIITAALIASTFSSVVPVSAAETTLLNSTFETGIDGWIPMGNTEIKQVAWTKNSGNNSLYIGRRQATWNGAAYNLSGKVQPGHTYKISTYWMSWAIHYNDDVKLTFSYKDNSGNTKYSLIGQNTAASGSWTNLSGTFTVPSGANQPIIYFETSKNTGELYIDDIKITEESSGNQQGQPQNPWENPWQNPWQDPNQGQQQNPNQGQPQDPNQGQPQDPNQGQTQNPPQQSGSMKEISDAYMKNVKIDTFCPSNVSAKRSNVRYGSFQHKTYYSTTARRNKGFNILLPTNYNPQKKYPVLYVLHGVMGDENSMLGNNIEVMLGNLIADGKAEEMIVVLPSMFSANDGSQPALNPKGMEGYDRFALDLKNDLMPYIQKNYSVSTDKKDTAIAGFSMGGRETLYIGVTNPDTFGYVGAFAPAPGATPGQDYIMYHKGQLQENQFKIADSSMPYLLMICGGTNDQVVGTFPENYHKILTRNNTNHIWYTVPGAGHDNTTIASGLNNFIRGIFHAK